MRELTRNLRYFRRAPDFVMVGTYKRRPERTGPYFVMADQVRHPRLSPYQHR